MTFNGWVQIALYVAVIVALTRPLGFYLDRVIGSIGVPDPHASSLGGGNASSVR